MLNDIRNRIDATEKVILKLRSKNGLELKPMTPDEIIDYSGFTRFDTFVNSSTNNRAPFTGALVICFGRMGVSPADLDRGCGTGVRPWI